MAVRKLLEVNMKMLKACALYPLEHDASIVIRIADRIYTWFNIVCLYSILITCASEMLIGENRKMTDYTLNMVNAGIYFCCVLTVHYFHARGEKGRELLTEMHQNFKYNADSEFAEANMEEVDKTTRKITKRFFTLITSGVICVALVPLLLPERTLPIPGKFPFDWKATPAYELLFTLQLYGQIVIDVVVCASDGLFVCMLLVVAEQFKVLGADFHNCLYKALSDAGFTKEEIITFKDSLGETEANIGRLLMHSRRSNSSGNITTANTSENRHLIEVIQSSNFQKNLKKMLGGYISHHQMLLNFCVKMENFFLPVISMKVALSLFYHIFISFALITVTDTKLKLTVAQYEVCALTEIFIFALAGQTLINESENVGDALYNCPWYYCNQEYQKIVTMIIMRSERPARVSVGKLVDMSLPTFITIMKMAYSYFAVLRRVTE